MEKETTKNTHHGHSVKRLRLERKLSQSELGKLIGMSQETVSRNEKKNEIEDAILEQFSKGLGVSKEFIKELEDDKPLTVYMENNTITNENSPGSKENIGTNQEINDSGTNNYADKNLSAALEQMLQLYKVNMQLYDQLLNCTRKELEVLKEEVARLKER